MKNYLLLLTISIAIVSISCTKNKKYGKGFSENPEIQSSIDNDIVGFHKDSVNLTTRPSSVLLTGYNKYRLLTIYKLNFDKRENSFYIGSNHFYRNYKEDVNIIGNNWHYNFMPGLQAVYGLNLVNTSIINIEAKTQLPLFDKPVLIKTIYYPSFSKDTLYNMPIKREYFMISVYDEDTNMDGFINLKDLRRFYLFNLDGENKKELIPKNYSVISSEYDPTNDFMYVFAQVDKNQNGQIEESEEIHVYWIDLKNPKNNGRIYK